MPSETVNEFTAGALGGLAGLVVGHPCDTMKTITQNSKAGDVPGMRKLGRQMRQLGPNTFFRGLSVPVWSYAVVNSVFFGTHKQMNKELGISTEASGPEDPTWFRLPTHMYCELVLSGAVAGAIQLIPSVPVEVIKVRMQKCAHLKGIKPQVRSTIVQIYREGGMRSFYRGLSAQFARDVPASASYFVSYEATRRAVRSSVELPDWLTSLIAGALGGWISWLLPLPLDVIKTRMQSGRDRSFIGCVRGLMAEGPHAFFAGLGLISVRAFLVNGVTFAGYEVAIKELNRASEGQARGSADAQPLLKSGTMAASPSNE